MLEYLKKTFFGLFRITQFSFMNLMRLFRFMAVGGGSVFLVLMYVDSWTSPAYGSYNNYLIAAALVGIPAFVAVFVETYCFLDRTEKKKSKRANGQYKNEGVSTIQTGPSPKQRSKKMVVQQRASK